MTRPDFQQVEQIACIGTGTIGAGWAALFLAHGKSVTAWDPGPDAALRLQQDVERAWPKLEALGLAPGADPSRLHFAADLPAAVSRAQFVQESAPDDEALKIQLIAEIGRHCPPQTVIASSSSTFLPSRLASACTQPERVCVGHPFVPAYLIPLVEVVGSPQGSPEVLAWVAGFYQSIGRTTITLAREIEGYVANRLQRALFKEACALVEQGVCSWLDIEQAVTAGPGFRWAVLGPLLHRHLGGGRGGVRHMIDHFGWSGAPGGETAFISAVEDRVGHIPMAELEQWRDRNLLTMLKELEPLPR